MPPPTMQRSPGLSCGNSGGGAYGKSGCGFGLVQLGGGKQPQLGTLVEVWASVEYHSSKPIVPGFEKPSGEAGRALFQKSPRCHLPTSEEV